MHPKVIGFACRIYIRVAVVASRNLSQPTLWWVYSEINRGFLTEEALDLHYFNN